MHDLIPADAIPPGSLTTAEIDQTMAYAEAEKAAATRAAYASDWRDFAAWCAQRAATPLPAHPGIVAAYLSHLASTGRKASRIGRRAASISYRHKLAGHEPPTNAEGVKATLRGIRRTIGAAPERKAPATAELIARMLDLCPDTLTGKRDRALLAFGFASAMRRSELCALQVVDLIEVSDGLRVTIRHSKTDQEGQGQEIAIPHGYRLRPVEAMQTWLQAAEITEGPIFRAVVANGVVDQALAPETACRIVKRYAARVGLDSMQFAGHSLRSGFLTSAAEAGASIWKLAEQSRHRSLDTLRGYVRRVDLFREHAGASSYEHFATRRTGYSASKRRSVFRPCLRLVDASRASSCRE